MLKKCPCGETPIIYGSGIARGEFNEDESQTDIYFTEFDGYYVACPECFEIKATDSHGWVENAIAEWNQLVEEYEENTYNHETKIQMPLKRANSALV